jgi:uncharacterized protein YjbI with pentapeptide repeats
MDAKELLARYAAGERNFIGANLNGADLSDAKLSDIDLTATTLKNVSLRNADLTNAVLIANLTDADLSNANLSGATLCGDLTDADLSNANLSGANLGASTLWGAKLHGANLTNADLRGADLRFVDLSDTNLSGAKWNGIIFPSPQRLEELQQENKRLIRRLKLAKAILGRLKRNQVSNQGINAPQKWQGFYFRSKTEIKIAEALDQVGVLFYPNCKARLSSAVGREGKETDFLVFYQGKWGILEVDGEPWHPPSRTVHDHERDRLFKVHGNRVVEHYDASRCEKQPDEVVREFLEILRQA